MSKVLLGSHVSMKAPKYFLGSVEEALSYGANTLMIYTGAPQNTRRTDMEKLRVEEAHELMKENGIKPENVIVHAPYIVNLANPDAEKRAFAVEFLKKEYKRTAQMGAKFLVLHPGAHLKQGSDIGVKYIAEGLNKILDPKIGTIITLETMAGKGTEVGRDFSELKGIIQNVKEKKLIGVCMDTCHVHDAGYDVTKFDELLDEFDDIVGLKYLKCMHINGSKNVRGAKKDRHANLGEGEISKLALKKIVNNKRIKDLPMALETPWRDGVAPYKEEIEYLKK